jgi:hypothetical protein
MVPLLPVAELLSFLKQTSGPWTERDISRALNLSSPEAKQAVAAMQLQGYVENTEVENDGGGPDRFWREDSARNNIKQSSRRYPLSPTVSAQRMTTRARRIPSLKPSLLETSFLASKHEFRLPTLASGLGLEKPVPKSQVRLWNTKLNKPSSSSSAGKVLRSTSNPMKLG